MSRAVLLRVSHFVVYTRKTIHVYAFRPTILVPVFTDKLRNAKTSERSLLKFVSHHFTAVNVESVKRQKTKTQNKTNKQPHQNNNQRKKKKRNGKESRRQLELKLGRMDHTFPASEFVFEKGNVDAGLTAFIFTSATKI